mmetsp:Transcript_58521/g.124160  ORF Transcript_58521/g.124160 Transcript_58521/m.124160 type:complete len:91 (-) Transcript_58521:2330-2602(-)
MAQVFGVDGLFSSLQLEAREDKLVPTRPSGHGNVGCFKRVVNGSCDQLKTPLHTETCFKIDNNFLSQTCLLANRLRTASVVQHVLLEVAQ